MRVQYCAIDGVLQMKGASRLHLFSTSCALSKRTYVESCNQPILVVNITAAFFRFWLYYDLGETEWEIPGCNSQS